MVILDGFMRLVTYALRLIIVLLLLRTLSTEAFVEYSAVASIIYLASFVVGYDRGGLFGKYINKLKATERTELIISINLFLLLAFLVAIPLPLLKISHLYPEVNLLYVSLIILFETLFIENRKLYLGGVNFRLAFIFDLLKSVLIIIGLTYEYSVSAITVDLFYKIWLFANVITVALILNHNKIMRSGALSLRNIVGKILFRLRDGGALYLSSGVLLLAEAYGRVVLSRGDPIQAAAYTVASALIFVPYVFAWSFFIAPSYPALIDTSVVDQTRGIKRLLWKGFGFLFFCQLIGLLLVEPVGLLLKPELAEGIAGIYGALVLIPFVQYTHNILMLRWQLLGMYNLIRHISLFNILTLGTLYLLIEYWTVAHVTVILYFLFSVSTIYFLSSEVCKVKSGI